MRTGRCLAMATAAGAALSAVATLTLSPAPVSAQPVPPVSQGIGLKVTGGLHALTGDDFGEAGLDLGSALGAEAVLSTAWASGWELGLGVGIGFNDPQGAEFGAEPSGDLVTIFAEPLYRFRPAATRTPHVHPFVGARFGWARLNLDGGADGDQDDVSANGLQAGALGGIELWVSDDVGLVGSAGFDFLSFGDLDGDAIEAADGPDGGRISLQGGIKVRFP